MNGWNIDIPDHPLLSDGETKELLQAAHAGDTQARSRLIESNLRLVLSIINRFQNRGFEMEDLFQVGSIGLVKSIDQFDLSYQVRFSTYAVPKIIGEIKRYIRESSTLHISRSLRELASKAIEAKDRLTDSLGRVPTINEIASKLGVEREDIVSALDSVSPIHSLQQVVYEDDGHPIMLEDQLAASADNMSFYLRDILSSLDFDERRIVLLRYFAENSQTQVATLLGISQAQVSRIEKRVLAQIRKEL